MTSSSFFIEEEALKPIPQERYYSTHKDSFGKSAVGYSNFKAKFPECFIDGLHYTVQDPTNRKEYVVNCIV